MRCTHSILVMVVLGGCVLGDPADGGGDTGGQLGPVIKHAPPPGCDDPLNCPGNSPVLAALGPYELSMNMAEVSPRGFTFDKDKVTQPGPYGGTVTLTKFEVVGASLHAYKNDSPIQDGMLVGAKLPLHHISGHNYTLEIWDYMYGQYYDGTSNLPFIIGYYIRYWDDALANAEPRDLCPYKDYDDLSDRPSTWAVFWKGERYDPATGKIFAIDDEVGDWFNISCAGEATIKMIRARASGAVAVGVPWRRRQATLNMFTAKYCPGDPHRYTHLGVALDWKDKTGPNGIEAAFSDEALWDADGARCLTQMRAPEDGPVVDCTLPLCTLQDKVFWKSRGELFSVNPPPPPP